MNKKITIEKVNGLIKKIDNIKHLLSGYHGHLKAYVGWCIDKEAFKIIDMERKVEALEKRTKEISTMLDDIVYKIKAHATIFCSKCGNRIT